MHPFFQDLSARFPLIQSPMAGAQDEELAIAVARAGGIGSLPCALSTPEDVQRAAARFRNATSGPLNLNFFCHKVTDRDAQREALWLEQLSEYYEELSLDPEYPQTEHLLSLIHI